MPILPIYGTMIRKQYVLVSGQFLHYCCTNEHSNSYCYIFVVFWLQIRIYLIYSLVVLLNMLKMTVTISLRFP